MLNRREMIVRGGIAALGLTLCDWRWALAGDAKPQKVLFFSKSSNFEHAVIKRKVDEDTFEVEVGSMKMKIPRHDVAEVVAHTSGSPVAAARAKGFSVSLKDDLNMPTEINVIGQTVDDATREVEKFVDRAFLAGMPRVRIVHGSGMGILRKALRQFLQQHPHVESVTEPPQNEGGAGATVVELRI